MFLGNLRKIWCVFKEFEKTLVCHLDLVTFGVVFEFGKFFFGNWRKFGEFSEFSNVLYDFAS
jgi:hypothetical protein